MTANVLITIAGSIVGLFVIGYICVDVLTVAAEKDDSDAMRKVILNYLQVSVLAANFPMRWPQTLESFFFFQGLASGNADMVMR